MVELSNGPSQAGLLLHSCDGGVLVVVSSALGMHKPVEADLAIVAPLCAVISFELLLHCWIFHAYC